METQLPIYPMATVKVAVRNVYGRDMIYPANAAACTLARIAGTKTLSVENLRDAKALGLTVTTEATVSPVLADIVSA